MAFLEFGEVLEPRDGQPRESLLERAMMIPLGRGLLAWLRSQKPVDRVDRAYRELKSRGLAV